MPSRTNGTHTSFCRELIVLPGASVWSLDTYCNPSAIYHLHVLFVEISYQSKILSSNIISCKFIYNANEIFKLWEFYRCREQTKCSHHQFSCLVHAFTSFCRAQDNLYEYILKVVIPKLLSIFHSHPHPHLCLPIPTPPKMYSYSEEQISFFWLLVAMTKEQILDYVSVSNMFFEWYKQCLCLKF